MQVQWMCVWQVEASHLCEIDCKLACVLCMSIEYVNLIYSENAVECIRLAEQSSTIQNEVQLENRMQSIFDANSDVYIYASVW